MSTTLVKCKCQHEQQDAMYGKGVRVANATAKGLNRCTVCNTEQQPRYAEPPVKSKKK